MSEDTQFVWVIFAIVGYMSLDITLAAIFKRCVLWPKCPACKKEGRHG